MQDTTIDLRLEAAMGRARCPERERVRALILEDGDFASFCPRCGELTPEMVAAHAPPPSYTSSWVAASALFPELLSRGLKIEISPDGKSLVGPPWGMAVCAAAGWADTSLEAFCFAALRALERGEE